MQEVLYQGVDHYVGSEKTREVMHHFTGYPVQPQIFFRPYFLYCSSNVHYYEDRFQLILSYHFFGFCLN